MAVQFKFRSSANFDLVDFEGPSISVRDLKSKIVRRKNLDLCQDFDLVFSDALTGQEYTDEKFQIPSGSSVIIKRVPAGSVPSNMVNFNSSDNVQRKGINITSTLPLNEVDDFDVFGIDLYSVPEATLSCSDFDTDKNGCIENDKKNDDVARCSKPYRERCQKPEESDLSEAIPRGPAHSRIEGNMSQSKPIFKVKEDLNIEKVVDANPLAMSNADLPSELKCPLCDSFFKEAVMIPCCQHSFCQKCIRLQLLEKGSCPNCFSTRCRVEHLLSNVSLRQAIEHFLDSQILTTSSGTAFHRYAPDGESGIQAKDMSCGVTILQREPAPHSPSATGRGSNQNLDCLLIRSNSSMGDISSRINQLGVNNHLKVPPLSHIIDQIDGGRHGSHHPLDIENRPGDLATFDDFQGESQPMHEEAVSNLKKRRFWVNNSAGGDETFVGTGRHKKGDRTCYMCGSPDHFIRDCPAASSPHHMLQRGSAMFPGAMQGYARPYWNGTPLPHVRPFGNLYSNVGMMPFNMTMVPTAPFAVPTYMPSMYGGFPAFSGCMTMGGVAPLVGPIEEQHLSHQEYVDFQNFEKRRKISNDNVRSGCMTMGGVGPIEQRHLSHQEYADFQNFEKRRKISNDNVRRMLTREQSPDDEEDEDFSKMCSYSETERSCDLKSPIKWEKSVSYSKDCYTQRSRKKNRHDNYIEDDKSDDERHQKSLHSSIAVKDQRSYHLLERSSSEVEDMPSSSKWHSKRRHQHHRRSSKKQCERRDKCCCYSCWSYHQTYEEKEVERKRNRSDVKRHSNKCHSHTESVLDQSLSSDRKKKQKETSHTSRHPNHNAKFSTDDLSDDRWQMVSGSDTDGKEDYHSYKRKRVH